MRKIKKNIDDPVVDRVRAARAMLVKDCDYDIEKYGRMLIERQSKSKCRVSTIRKFRSSR